jgi:hypothetical protein
MTSVKVAYFFGDILPHNMCVHEVIVVLLPAEVYVATIFILLMAGNEKL